MKISVKSILILFAVILLYSFNISIEAFGAELLPPDNFKAEINGRYIELTWKNNDSNFSRTVIERSTDYGEFIEIASLSKSRTSYKDGNIENGHAYIYRARTEYRSSESSWTSEQEVIYLYATSLDIVYTSDTYVDLEWNFPRYVPIEPEDYEVVIERRTYGKKKWTDIGTLPITELKYRDDSVEPDTVYYYRIKTIFPNNDESRYIPGTSGISTRTTYPLKTPLWGYAYSNSRIKLEWEMPDDSDVKAYIQRKNSAGDFITIFSSNSADSYVDTNLRSGEIYTYRLYMKPKNGSESEFSDEISVKTERISQSPWRLEANQLSSQRIALTWEFPFDDESEFEVWRKDSDGWANIAVLPRNTLSFVDTGVKSNESYIYKVRVKRDDTVFSPFSRLADIDYSYPAIPEKPLCYTYEGFLFLYSNDEIPKNTTYTLEYRENINDKWKDLRTSYERYLMVSIPYSSDSEYQFRVRANAGNLASYSQILNFSGKPPVKPVSFNAEFLGYNSVKLTWKNADDKTEGFNIYRISESGDRELLKTCSINESNYIDEAPLAGTGYRYEITAFNTAGESQKVSTTVLVPKSQVFKDISQYKWAHDAIGSLLGKGVLDYGNGNFYPQASLTKGEAVRWILRAFNIDYNNQGLFTLNDLAPNHAYYKDIISGINAGIIYPDSSDRIFPGNTLTRRDIVLMLNNALSHLDIPLISASDEILRKYSDYYEILPGEKHIIASFVQSGIIVGNGDSLNLSAKVSKVEAAVIIYRTLNRYKYFM